MKDSVAQQQVTVLIDEILGRQSSCLTDAITIENVPTLVAIAHSTNLDLLESKFDRKVAKTIISFVHEGTATLCGLHRGKKDCHLDGEEIGPGGAILLAWDIQYGHARYTLKTLDVANNKLDLPSSKLILDAIPHSQLKYVDVSFNNLTNYGRDTYVIDALTEAITASKSLTTLNISGSYIYYNGTVPLSKQSGLDALSTAVKKCRTLKTLDISNNYLGPKGAAEIAFSIPALTCLNLAGNDLGKEGAEALAGAIGYSETLKSLDMSRNYLYPKGLELLASGLSESTSLVTIDISDNHLTGINRYGIGTPNEEGIKALAQAMARNKTLKEVRMIGNSLENTALVKLDRVAREKHIEIIHEAPSSLGSPSTLGSPAQMKLEQRLF